VCSRQERPTHTEIEVVVVSSIIEGRVHLLVRQRPGAVLVVKVVSTAAKTNDDHPRTTTTTMCRVSTTPTPRTLRLRVTVALLHCGGMNAGCSTRGIVDT
jgi:hypothetical protein